MHRMGAQGSVGLDVYTEAKVMPSASEDSQGEVGGVSRKEERPPNFPGPDALCDLEPLVCLQEQRWKDLISEILTSL